VAFTPNDDECVATAPNARVNGYHSSTRRSAVFRVPDIRTRGAVCLPGVNGVTRGLPYRAPLLAGLIAVVVAAVLVVLLQYQSGIEQERRTAVIIRQVCERSAGVLGGRLRELFGGAVLHTIEAIGHRELKAYNLARVDHFFDAGVKQHAYVSRFFLWHERLPRHLRDEVLFYRPAGEAGTRDVAIAASGERRGGFFRDRARGEQLWRSAGNMLAMGKGFAIEETLLDGVPHQVIYHFFWDDGQRHKLYAVIGFIVNLDELRRGGRFTQIVTKGLEPLLNPRPDFVRLALRVEDETGKAVLGPLPTPTSAAGWESFDLLFFPRNELGNYVVQIPPVPRWRLTVSPTGEMPVSNGIGFWLLAVIVLLLLFVAVVCAVSVNRQAIRLSQLQSDFVANVSHQLRTPLAMLSGAAETLGLERVRSPAKVKEYADIVQAQAQRLSVLVDQILHFHRAEFAGREPVRQKVDLCTLTTRAAQQFQELANASGVTMRVECNAPGLVVQGDPVALEFAVVNLLENAVKYGGGANEVTVSVSASRGYGVITVRDRGIGIARADMPHIFDKFYRGGGEGQSRRGFGLGLAIVRSTVMVHGGRIAVTSEPGRGSEFTVSLPLSA
jgi:signal transduction histidine kinase